MSKRLFILLVFVAVITSCASTHKVLQLNRPYDSVARITIPLPPPSYKPAKIAFKMSLTIDRTISAPGEISVTKIGDQLLWDVNLRFGAERYSFRMLTDSQGGGVQLEAPLVTGNRKDQKRAQAEALEISKSSLYTLTNNEIVSGDVLWTVEQTPLTDADNITSYGNAKGYLEGWAFYGGRRVLVTTMEGKWTIADSMGRSNLLTGTGYALLDPVTYHVIYSEVLMTTLDGDRPIAKSTYTADIAPH